MSTHPSMIVNDHHTDSTDEEMRYLTMCMDVWMCVLLMMMDGEGECFQVIAWVCFHGCRRTMNLDM